MVHSRESYRESDARRNRVAVTTLQRARTLPREEQKALEQQVVLEYLDVARAVAARFPCAAQDRRDVLQVACIGLTKAAQRFEPRYGTDFVAYAVPTITGEIKRYLRDTTWEIRPPRKLQDLASEIMLIVPEMMHVIGREPTVIELSTRVGHPVSLVREALQSLRTKRLYSLDSPSSDAPDDPPLSALLVSHSEEISRVHLSVTLLDACKSLTTQQREILFLRFYREFTQEEIAQTLGISQMQVSRSLRVLLDTLKAQLESLE